MKKRRLVRVLFEKYHNSTDNILGQIDREIVRKTHFGGFGDEEEEEEVEGQVSISLCCILSDSVLG